jgi:hypothetical protein
MRSSPLGPLRFALVVSIALPACSGRRTAQDGPSVVVVAQPGSTMSNPSLPATSALQTPGRVRCAGQPCDLRDSFCSNEGNVESISLRCIPKGSEFQPDRVVPYSMLCDDASDCKAGEVCCQNAIAGGYVVYECGKPPCSLRETCIEGGACRPGLTCQLSSDSPTGATCVSAHKGAQCGKQRCSGPRPVCCWNAQASTGTCVGESEPCATRDGSKAAHRCSSRADCGGYFCAAQVDGTFCVGEGYVFMGVSCMTKDDCPARSSQTGQPYVGCKIDAAGSGNCVEEDDPGR